MPFLIPRRIVSVHSALFALALFKGADKAHNHQGDKRNHKTEDGIYNEFDRSEAPQPFKKAHYKAEQMALDFNSGAKVDAADFHVSSFYFFIFS